MNNSNNILQSKQGSTLAIAVIMLAVASIAIGSILTLTVNYTRNTKVNQYRNKAAFLADAGLQAALVKLNAYDEGNISFNQSRSYFTETNGLTAPDWGFHSQMSFMSGSNIVTSTGRYNGQEVVVQGSVSLGAGSRSIHALYAHALFSGNSGNNNSYTLEIGGWGSGADFINGDTYSGNDIELTGNALLRLPEALAYDDNGDGVFDMDVDTWQSSYATQVFTNPLDQSTFDSYKSAQQSNLDKTYHNGKYDLGEAFVDTIGNGIYNLGEPFTDLNGNGIRDNGDGYIDVNENGQYDAGIDTMVDNGNGQYDAGEEWTEDNDPNHHGKRVNGRYDAAGGFWKWQAKKHRWRWKRNYKKGGVRYYCNAWPAELYEDVGDGNYEPAEPYIDQNGVYDEGEEFVDDRNPEYDYGTQASGNITGMPSPGPGQKAANGGDAGITPPDLAHMYYGVNRNDPEPTGALPRWGNDVAVTASDYSSNGKVINNSSIPEHIFVRNVRRSDNGHNSQYYNNYGGVTVRSRWYDYVYDDDGDRVDDYFFEDPTDSTYNSMDYGNEIDGTHYTAPMYVDVHPEGNVLVYYVEGNVYLHATPTYALRFKRPGTRITIVAKGNITISDEFYYNADYEAGLNRSDVDSTIVNNPSDVLCLIALKNPDCTDSGNIYIGDPAYGTGGSIHAMLYAENNFVDNNLNSASQPFISIFGNMTAGNEVVINRSGSNRTRLDITLDERIKNGEIIVPGLPHPVGSQRSIRIDTAWHMVDGTWKSWSMLE